MTKKRIIASSMPRQQAMMRIQQMTTLLFTINGMRDLGSVLEDAIWVALWSPRGLRVLLGVSVGCCFPYIE